MATTARELKPQEERKELAFISVAECAVNDVLTRVAKSRVKRQLFVRLYAAASDLRTQLWALRENMSSQRPGRRVVASRTVAKPVRYNVQRFAEDMARKGFTKLELASERMYRT